MRKKRGPQMPCIDSGLIEVGDSIGFWDTRTDSQRWGKLQKITERFLYIQCREKIKRVPVNDRLLYLFKDSQMFEIVETP